MTSDTVFTLRSRLRADTGERHARLDRGISTIDIATRPGFVRFMQTHHRAFRALDVAAPLPALRDLADRAARDLDQLGAPEAPAPDGAAALDPLAVDYILHGSRLGTKVLKRRWQATEDPQVRAAAAYFDAPIDPEGWRATCDALAARPAAGPAADRVVSDALRIFDIFGTALACAPGEKGRHVA